jgi:T5SS/PEP-CTERM-associated repeat protein
MRTRAHRRFTRHSLAIAATFALMVGANPTARAQYYGYGGAVSSFPTNLFPIDVSTALLNMTGNTLDIGEGAPGSFSALAGSQLLADAIIIGNGGSGSGSLTATGSDALVRLGGTRTRLTVGNWGSGTMEVSGGAVVDATVNLGACAGSGFGCGTTIGGTTGATGTLTITGAGSEVRLDSFNLGQTSVYPGYGVLGGTSTGNLDITAGGILRSSNTYLGYTSGSLNSGSETSIAKVKVDGSGSQWVITSDTVNNLNGHLRIGGGSSQSTADVLVSNGGLLIVDGSAGANGGWAAIGLSGSQGSLKIQDAGSQLQVIGGPANIAVGATGSFSALSGASVFAGGLTVGSEAPGNFATATIAGAETTVGLNGINGRLLIGNPGSGTLTVSGGALLDGTLNAGACSAPGAWCGNLIGAAAGSTGNLTVTGANSQVKLLGTSVGSAWVDNGYGVPGGTSTGTIQVLAGGSLSTQGVTLGGGQGAPGANGNEHSSSMVTIDGSGSQWTASADMFAGGAYFNIGEGPRATSTVTVSGGGKLALDASAAPPGSFSSLTVGDNGGQGTLSVSGGGSVQIAGGGNSAIFVANGVGANGISSTGSFNVLSGAQVSAGLMVVANGLGSTGSVTVSGLDSAVTLTGTTYGRLSIGQQGTATVQVLNGGVIDASTSLAGCSAPGAWCGGGINTAAGSTGTLTISGPGSKVLTAGFGVGSNYADVGYGIPGGTSLGTIEVLQGGSLGTQNVTLGYYGNGGPLSNGNEHVVANVTIDGADSKWTSGRDTIGNGGANFTLGAGPNTQATVTVRNGGALVVDGTGAPVGSFSSFVVGQGGGHGTLDITGNGSVQLFNAGAAVGSGTGSTGALSISSGGKLVLDNTGFQPRSIVIGQSGGQGTLNIGAGGSAQLLNAGIGIGGATGGNGTLSITNGGTLSSTGGSGVANGSGPVTGTVIIDGLGSSWTITRDLASGGGQAGLSIAPVSNADGSLTLKNGATLSVNGARANPASDNSIPNIGLATSPNSTGTMSVGSGSAVTFSGDTGVLIVGGGAGQASNGATALLNITGGGAIEGTGNNGLVYVALGRNQADGTLKVDGVGSRLKVAGVGGTNTQGLDGTGGLIDVGRNRGFGGGTGTMNVTGGGSVVISDNGQVASNGGVALRLAQGADTSGTVKVSGPGSSIVVTSTSGSSATTPYVYIGNGGVGQMTISNGGSVSVLGSGERDFIVGNSSTGSGTLNVNTGGNINASWFAVGNNGGLGTATIDGSTVSLDGVVYPPNLVPVGAGVRVGRGVGANGTLNLQNGAIIDVHNTTAGSNVILGGTSVLPGGTGTLNMSSGSAINFTGPAAGASLQIGGVTGAGGSGGTGTITMTGNSVVNLGATGQVFVGGNAGTSGTLTIASASAINAGQVSIGGNSDTVAGGNGTAAVTGAGSALNAIGVGNLGDITVGRNATGLLAVSNGGTASAIDMGVGGYASGVGTLSVNGSTLNLTGQHSNASGSGIVIGFSGGTGTASITNGSTVNITNMGAAGAGLFVGGDPDDAAGTGTLAVSNSAIRITAQPGLAGAAIGYSGTGTATLTNSTLDIGTVNASGRGADGSLYIAPQPGSTGVLTLSAGTVVNTGFVGIGVSQPAIVNGNAITQFNGGNGHLILDNSKINTTALEIGANGVLSGNGGTVNATGSVIVRGTISPGDSPGRININCDLKTLAGSKLILDILDTGGGLYSVDHLIIGNDATFDLFNLQIVFNFLGNTDPNAFAASGEFNLDNFLQTLDLSNPNATPTGLSSVFGTWETAATSWDTAVDLSDITAVSSAYDITNLQFMFDTNTGAGQFTLTAAPIPEPPTWAIALLGLLAMGAAARRRPFVARPLRPLGVPAC